MEGRGGAGRSEVRSGGCQQIAFTDANRRKANVDKTVSSAHSLAECAELRECRAARLLHAKLQRRDVLRVPGDGALPGARATGNGLWRRKQLEMKSRGKVWQTLNCQRESGGKEAMRVARLLAKDQLRCVIFARRLCNPGWPVRLVSITWRKLCDEFLSA